jgi:cytochrome c oxidase assembly protein subunit 19
MNLSSNKLLKPRPPERGSFPLDHEGLCKNVMTQYIQCMKKYNHIGIKCRTLSRKYVECRMEHGLMAKDELQQLGLEESPLNTS